MRKPLSNMTAQEFIEYTAALGMRYGELAKALGRSHTMVSLYVNGKRPIPRDVAISLDQLYKARIKQLQSLTGRLAAGVGEAIVMSNEIRHARERAEGALYRNELTLPHRLDNDPELRKTFPPYRLTQERHTLFVRCLAAWHAEVLTRLKGRLDDERRIRMHKLELADIKAIAAIVPRAVPYDIVITVGEWFVVSRALRWGEQQHIAGARALYWHWRRHKGSGFPHRQRAQARSDIQVTQPV